MLHFKPVSLDMKPAADSYFYRFGEGSCQHSFTTMFCMRRKYGDMLCEQDGWLYTLRSGRCTQGERVYLTPMGDGGEASLRRAIENILDDAHAHGVRVRFETLTERAKDAVLSLCPGIFHAEPARDYAEYIYSHDRLALLPGHAMASKRHDISTFFRDFGDRVSIEILRPEHIPAVRAFQEGWMRERTHGAEDVQLDSENAAIDLGLANYAALGLSGIVLFIDGEIKGYAYGAPLSESCYDVIIEKGDRSIPDIYRVLNRDLVRLCCGNFAWINREEDVGVPGLRKAKLSYHPDYLLEKYIVKELSPDE